MDYKSLLKIIFVFFTLSVISSCGSYQYTSYMNDGIYEDDSNITQSNTYDIEENNDEETSEYYSSYFNDIAKRYSTSEDNDELFTDVENYRSSENDSISKTYGPWGDYKNSLTINFNSYHNNGFWSRSRYPSWMWNYGYGYGNVWGYGFNNFWSRPYPFYSGFMIHLILSGDIMVPFIMGMDMVIVTHTDIIHGGDHMAIGIIITHMAEI